MEQQLPSIAGALRGAARRGGASLVLFCLVLSSAFFSSVLSFFEWNKEICKMIDWPCVHTYTRMFSSRSTVLDRCALTFDMLCSCNSAI